LRAAIAAINPAVAIYESPSLEQEPAAVAYGHEIPDVDVDRLLRSSPRSGRPRRLQRPRTRCSVNREMAIRIASAPPAAR
jgi:hypothetical protein